MAERYLDLALVGAPLGFGGGTSLSKAYGAIRRFSEDVDLTYDIRALVPELVRSCPDALPPNRSQEKRWTKAVDRALGAWIREAAAPVLARALKVVEPGGEVAVKGGDVVIRYAPLQEGTGYGRPEVKLEFGGRATGEPGAAMEFAAMQRTMSGASSSRYAELLGRGGSPDELLQQIEARPVTEPDQWQVQVQAMIQRRARVLVKAGGLTAEQLAAAHFEPAQDLDEAIAECLAGRPDGRVCVLPEGPQTIPYIS